MKLNLGSGYNKIEGFINIDNDLLTNPDCIVDFENNELPFEDNSIDEIRAHHILEHIGDGFIFLMQEIYRVCKNNALIDIIVPHHMHEVFYSDPTHKRAITVNTFYLFSKKFNEESIQQKSSHSTLAIKYNVDFELISFNFKFDTFYYEYLKNYNEKQSIGNVTFEENLLHTRLMREAWNVVTDVIIKLRVIKNA